MPTTRTQKRAARQLDAIEKAGSSAKKKDAPEAGAHASGGSDIQGPPNAGRSTGTSQASKPGEKATGTHTPQHPNMRLYSRYTYMT